MIVDAHVHVVSPDATWYPLDPPDPTRRWYLDAPVSVEELLAAMDDAGVEGAVLVQAVGAYRFDNGYVLDAARMHARRCASVVCVDTTAPGAAGLVGDLVERGARGLRWWALGEEPLAEPRALWEVVSARALPVVVTMFAPRLGELEQLIPSLPPVPLALDHCAFADLSRGVPPELRALARHPSVTLKVSTIVLDQLARHGDVRDGLAELVACFGADRLMWGSDYCQTHDRPYAELVELARTAASGLDADARAAFLGGTARRVWPELAG